MVMAIEKAIYTLGLQSRWLGWVGRVQPPSPAHPGEVARVADPGHGAPGDQWPLHLQASPSGAGSFAAQRGTVPNQRWGGLRGLPVNWVNWPIDCKNIEIGQTDGF